MNSGNRVIWLTRACGYRENLGDGLIGQRQNLSNGLINLVKGRFRVAETIEQRGILVAEEFDLRGNSGDRVVQVTG